MISAPGRGWPLGTAEELGVLSWEYVEGKRMNDTGREISTPGLLCLFGGKFAG